MLGMAVTICEKTKNKTKTTNESDANCFFQNEQKKTRDNQKDKNYHEMDSLSSYVSARALFLCSSSVSREMHDGCCNSDDCGFICKSKTFTLVIVVSSGRGLFAAAWDWRELGDADDPEISISF